MHLPAGVSEQDLAQLRGFPGDRAWRAGQVAYVRPVRKKIFSSFACDGTPAYRPYATAFIRQELNRQAAQSRTGRPVTSPQ
jgi:hypothetical protein